ncbi:MAG: flagellar hook assembly protein FlgD [Geminicoccaceae bacterium]
MDVNGIAGSTTAATAKATGLGANFNTFLGLLTAQLQNQDPLSPMDATKFTSQLVEFSSVEQAIQTNKKLDELTKLTQASSATAALGYIGRGVEASSSKVLLPTSGNAQIGYALPRAGTVLLTVTDERGRTVFQSKAQGQTGANSFAWNGLGTDGARLPSGLYGVALSAVGVDGKPLQVDRTIRGDVAGVEIRDGIQYLMVGGLGVPASSTTRITTSA